MCENGTIETILIYVLKLELAPNSVYFYLSEP
jgi:hypothetical protein